MHDRETIQKAYIRICRDSNFQIEYINAAILTANVLKISPIEVWIAIGDFGAMKKIAKGGTPLSRNGKI